jgi:hypothetical protein
MARPGPGIMHAIQIEVEAPSSLTFPGRGRSTVVGHFLRFVFALPAQDPEQEGRPSHHEDEHRLAPAPTPSVVGIS